MNYTLYEVGGAVRDRILGLRSKDIDYSVVLDTDLPIAVALYDFEQELMKEGYEIFLTKLDCQTIRAMFPKDHQHSGVADFVVARKEMGYIRGSRTPIVRVGTLLDDLERRDFTVNAIAIAEDGSYIDPYNGQKDLKDMILRTPTDTAVSFNEDPLRIIRAMRFAITKGFEFSDAIWRTVVTFEADTYTEKVSTERTREELLKCFHHDTRKTFEYLRGISMDNHRLYEALLPDDIWLKPTTEK